MGHRKQFDRRTGHSVIRKWRLTRLLSMTFVEAVIIRPGFGRDPSMASLAVALQGTHTEEGSRKPDHIAKGHARLSSIPGG